jgi:hypothetical protein
MSQTIPSRELDTNINILHAMMRPGERLSSHTIAEAVGCSNTLIYLIEKKALKKVRERIRKEFRLNHAELAQADWREFL